MKKIMLVLVCLFCCCLGFSFTTEEEMKEYLFSSFPFFSIIEDDMNEYELVSYLFDKKIYLIDKGPLENGDILCTFQTKRESIEPYTYYRDDRTEPYYLWFLNVLYRDGCIYSVSFSLKSLSSFGWVFDVLSELTLNDCDDGYLSYSSELFYNDIDVVPQNKFAGAYLIDIELWPPL